MNRIVKVWLLLLFSCSAFGQHGTAVTKRKYTYLPLKKCSGDCASYLTDSTSRIKMVKYNSGWVDLIHPMGKIIFEGKQYTFSRNLIPLAGSDLQYVSFQTGGVDGYLVSDSLKKYLVLSGGILGSTGISGRYSLVVVIDLNTSLKNKRRKVYGLLASGFTIEDVIDFNNDGIPDIRLKEGRRRMVSLNQGI